MRSADLSGSSADDQYMVQSMCLKGRFRISILYAIVVLEGFVSIAVEILALRQALPFIGSNIVITSSIIGTFLLFLSFGYYAGGKRQGNFIYILQVNFLSSQILIVFGLSMFTLSYLSGYFYDNFNVLFFYLLLVLSPTSFLLGQTLPLLSNFMTTNSLPEFSGKLLFMSTIGSFLGSVFTATILMNFIGVGNTITFLSLVLSLLIVFTLRGNNVGVGLFLASLSITVLSYLYVNNSDVYGAYIAQGRVPLPIEYENAFSTVSVTKEDGVNYLSVNGNYSSSYSPQEESSWFYYSDMINKYLSNYAGLEILVAGAGAFTIGVDDHENNFTYIDIDKDLQGVSEDKIIEKEINGVFVVDDIRHYLSSTDKMYDVIISDVYQGMTVPTALVTKEYFELINKRLESNGVLFANTISVGDLSSPFSLLINNTLSSINVCMGMLPEEETVTMEQTNILYFCRPRTTNDVLTDDRINELYLLNP